MKVLRTLGLALALLTPFVLSAQPPGGGQGPIVKIIPAGGSFTTQNVSVTVEWCSARPFAMGPEAESRCPGACRLHNHERERRSRFPSSSDRRYTSLPS